MWNKYAVQTTMDTWYVTAWNFTNYVLYYCNSSHVVQLAQWRIFQH